MRLHEEGFDALVQRRVEDITNKLELTHPDLLRNLSEFRQRPSSKALAHVTIMKEYKQLLQSITRMRSQMMVNYLKDVSNILAIVSAVQTGNITQYFQAEKQMLKLIFVFHHIIPRCLSQLSLKENPQSFKDLLKYGFGAKSSGETSRKIHGNVVKQHFKEESKGTAEPCR